MFDTLRNFGFEVILALVAVALIGAGLALLGAPQGWIVANIPIVGRLLDSIKHAAATVLIGVGLAILGFVTGYVHRGTVEQQAALLDRIATQEAVKAETERREKEFAAARAADAELADQLAVENQALREKQRKDDEASHTGDTRPGLRRDGVRRLNSIGGRGSRR